MRHLLSIRSWTLASLFVALACFGLSNTALAQDEETVKVEGKHLTIEVKDGKVYINGEEVDEEDGSYVLDLKGDGEVLALDLDGLLVLRERTMEVETYRLSEQIRTMEDGEPRKQRLTELSEKLNNIFDLKQVNRRSEIEQLESRLEELQRGLQEREQMRARIIQRRLKELLGSLDW